MPASQKMYTIIYSDGKQSETLKTGLSLDQAQSWLAEKAASVGQQLTKDLTVSQPKEAGQGTWSAVIAE